MNVLKNRKVVLACIRASFCKTYFSLYNIPTERATLVLTTLILMIKKKSKRQSKLENFKGAFKSSI